MLLAERITIPDDTQALFPDLDGVTLSLLEVSIDLVNRLVRQHIAEDLTVPEEVIRANFGYDIPAFWRRILLSIGLDPAEPLIENLSEEYESLRLQSTPTVFSGITELFAASRDAGLSVTVVSNNTTAHIEKLLSLSGLTTYVDDIVGLDNPGLAAKPAPDLYRQAAKRLALSPEKCVVLEDSVLGARAAAQAGCFTIGIATGANTYQQLANSPYVSRGYPDLTVKSTASSSVVRPSLTARIERITRESDVVVDLTLNGSGKVNIDTGVPFYDHMLTAFGTHGAMDLTIKASGDRHIDAHHTVEDIAIVLGQAIRKALGTKTGIRRFGDAWIPMDEVLAHAAVDVSGRPYCLHQGEPEALNTFTIGNNYPFVLNRHVFESLAFHAQIALHVRVLYGRDPHHLAEAQFKAIARALREAVSVDSHFQGVAPSTKGVL